MQQCEPAMEDAVANLSRDWKDPTDPTYLKLHHAPGRKGYVTIDADADDLAELLDRFDYEIETCRDNITDTGDSYERGYWLGRLRAAQCFIKKYGKEIIIKTEKLI
jgi:hypothetical protein